MTSGCVKLDIASIPDAASEAGQSDRMSCKVQLLSSAQMATRRYPQQWLQVSLQRHIDMLASRTFNRPTLDCLARAVHLRNSTAAHVYKPLLLQLDISSKMVIAASSTAQSSSI